MSGTPAGAVVTGAGRGLGKQIARLLVERGYTVLVTDLDEATATEAAAELGPNAIAQSLDVRDFAQTAAACEALVVRAGRLDLWVNNAGVLVTGPAWEQDEATRRLMVEVNTIGTMNGTVAAIEAMREHGGHIVNIVSLAGLTSVPGEAVYSGSKHAAVGFSLSTLADLRLAGVRNVAISCVCPDGIWTPMLFDKLDDPAAAMSFSSRLLDPQEVVTAVGRVLDHPRPVTAVPRSRGVQARAAAALPRLGLRLLPVMVAVGRRAQKKLRTKGLRDTVASRPAA